MSEDPLPGGGLAVISEPAPNAIPGVFDSAAAETLWIAGGDAKIYRASWSGGAPQPMQAALSEPAVALALLDGGRLAAAVGSSVAILSRTDGKISQTLDLSEPPPADFGR